MEIDTSASNGHLPFFYMNMGVPNNPATSRPRMATSEIHTPSSQQPNQPSPMNVNSNSPSIVSPVITRRVISLNDANNPTVNVSLANNLVMDASLEQQLRQLRQQHELQQQFLLEQFQHQQRQLKTQQKLQLQQHITEYREQQRLEESRVEQERLEKVKLEALKKKGTHEQSAVASEEVKKQLARTILMRQQKGSITNISNNSQSSFQNWSPQLGKYDNNYPLQKSASLPNLKSQSSVKQKVLLENRNTCSPLLRRRDKGFTIRRKNPLTIDGTGNTTPDSSPNSPPNGVSSLHSRSSSGSTPIQEEPSGSSFGVLSQGNLNDHALHTSMPNISLGKPPGSSNNNSGDNSKVTVISEAQIRAMAAASFGMPLTGHVLPGILPFYPSLPVLESEFTPPTSPAYITQQMKSLEQQSRITGTSTSGIVPGLYHGIPITDAQVAQARLHRAGHRPLSRTQSAPLPLGHPNLQPQQMMVITRQQQERYLQERQLYDQQQQHNLLKQTSIPVISEYYEHDLEFEINPPYNCMSPYSKHIRQTVLTRAGSKNHVENVEEETEAAVALALGDQEVIDLTDKKSNTIDSEMVRQQREIYLQQQRDIMMRHASQTISEEPVTENVKNCKLDIEVTNFTRHPIARPLSRALSSPLVTLSPTGSPQEQISTDIKHIFTTGLAFDTYMQKHQCICGDNSSHPEHHGRLKSIWARLLETGLVSHCEKIAPRKASFEEIQSCHSQSYTYLFGSNPLSRQKLDFSQLAGDLPIKSFVALPCGGVGVDSDTTWSEMHTSGAARMAAGCVIDLSTKVASRELKNGFAIVRPPGHHAEHNQAMGFCFFNSIAIAAKQLRQRLNLDRILIVDWDVHHGNGTQQMFYNDRHVLYISMHRHEEGNFFPGTGGPEEIGVDGGVGFNVNIAWSSFLRPPMGDAEYMAAFRTLVMPIARDFNPEIVLVSCGFDAAAGHPDPLGGYKVSPQCFGYMTRQLMQLAGGRIVLTLEGGYDLQAICDCAEQCVKALLGNDISPLSDKELTRIPCQPAIETLQKALTIQAPHWPCIKRWGHLIGMSAIEAQQKEKEESETVSALASLSMVHGNRNVIDCGMFANQNGNAVSVVTSAPSLATATATVSSQHNESEPSSLRSSPDHGCSPIEVEEPMEQEDTDAK